MIHKTTIFIFLFLFSLNFAVADFGYKDNSKPILEAPQSTSVTIDINDSLLNVNNSDLLDGTDWDDHINGSANQLCYFDGSNSVKGMEDTIWDGSTALLNIRNNNSNTQLAYRNGNIEIWNWEFDEDQQQYQWNFKYYLFDNPSIYIPTRNLSAQCYTFMDGTTQCTAWTGQSYNSTYNNILGNQCPSGQAVNGTYANGTIICTTISSGMNYTNIAMTNQTNVFTSRQDFTSTINVTNANPSYIPLIYLPGSNPGFWLDEKDGPVQKGFYLVLDNGDLQWQRRAQNFSTYEASPVRISVRGPDNALATWFDGRVALGGWESSTYSHGVLSVNASRGGQPSLYLRNGPLSTTIRAGSLEHYTTNGHIYYTYNKSGSNLARERLITENTSIPTNFWANVSFLGNATFNSIQLTSVTLDACTTALTGTLQRNGTGTYGCNGSCWGKANDTGVQLCGVRLF